MIPGTSPCLYPMVWSGHCQSRLSWSHSKLTRVKHPNGCWHWMVRWGCAPSSLGPLRPGHLCVWVFLEPRLCVHRAGWGLFPLPRGAAEAQVDSGRPGGAWRDQQPGLCDSSPSAHPEVPGWDSPAPGWACHCSAGADGGKCPPGALNSSLNLSSTRL